MELVLKYVEYAIKFRNMALDEKDPVLRASLEKQAEAYHELARKRAREMGMAPIDEQE